VSATADEAQRSAGLPDVWKQVGKHDAALLHDSTLRRDVIITAGPKVFTGRKSE
jgi:hypothetical protein